MGDKNGKIIHGVVEKLWFKWNLVWLNMILNFGGLCREMGMARLLFDNMLQGNIESWNFMITQLVKIGEFEGANGFLLLIPERNVASVDIDDVQWRTNTLLVAAQYGTQEQLKLLYDNDTLKEFVMKWY